MAVVQISVRPDEVPPMSLLLKSATTRSYSKSPKPMLTTSRTTTMRAAGAIMPQVTIFPTDR